MTMIIPFPVVRIEPQGNKPVKDVNPGAYFVYENAWYLMLASGWNNECLVFNCQARQPEEFSPDTRVGVAGIHYIDSNYNVPKQFVPIAHALGFKGAAFEGFKPGE